MEHDKIDCIDYQKKKTDCIVIRIFVGKSALFFVIRSFISAQDFYKGHHH